MQTEEKEVPLVAADVAGWLGVSPRTVEHWARTNQIPCRKVGKQWFFLKSAIVEFLKGKEVCK
jgi:excisionase family DNA binding protein